MADEPVTDVPDTPGVIAPPPLIALLALLSGLALDRLLPAYALSLLLDFALRVGIGVALIGGGVALAIAGERRFARAGTEVKPWRPSTVLVTDGVFERLRNPMYVGATMMLAGFAVAFASDWTLVMTVVFALVIHFGVVKREECYLEIKFGNAYRSYTLRVPRYGWPPVA
jgi:protein-S-isoprenylcysteine O-methyltransferase Ste14